MPFAFIIIGVTLIVTGAKGTTSDFLALLKKDFQGSNSFVPWICSILIIGSLGYIQPLRPVSRAFLALVLLVLFISNGGFFQKFSQDVLGK